jgi:large subunit ribosomal protein L7/L12
MQLKKPKKNKENIMADETTAEETQATEAPAEETKVEETATEAPAAKEETKEEKTEVPAKFKDLVGTIEKLSVLELSELVKVLEGHFGVSAAAPMAMAAGPAAGGGDAAAAEEKSSYTVMLTSAGEQKINVIKAVREITGLGLAESKALVDGAPKAVKENVAKAEAEEAKKSLEEAGATVELQ